MNKSKAVYNNVLDDNHRRNQWFIKLMLVMGGDCASTERYVGLRKEVVL